MSQLHSRQEDRPAPLKKVCQCRPDSCCTYRTADVIVSVLLEVQCDQTLGLGLEQVPNKLLVAQAVGTAVVNVQDDCKQDSAAQHSTACELCAKVAKVARKSTQHYCRVKSRFCGPGRSHETGLLYQGPLLLCMHNGITQLLPFLTLSPGPT